MKKAVNSGLILLRVPFSYPDVGCGSASTPRWGANRIALREKPCQEFGGPATGCHFN